MPDQHKNFAYGAVATPPSPPTTGSTLTLGAGQGALMPTPPFNATIWPAASLPLASVSEIVRVTAMSGDQVTAMTRAQEGTTAQAIAGGYQFAAGITVKTVADLEALAVPNYVTTTSTGTQNDFAPGLISGAQNILYCNNATDLTITGFSASGIAGGTRLTIYSIGAGNVYFVHQSAGSSAADRLTNFATSANTPLAAMVGAAEFIYDSTVGSWRLKTHEQGEFVDYTAVSTIGGWSTLTTKSIRYFLRGRQLQVNFYLDGTSNATTATFTIPFTTFNGSGGFSRCMFQAFDNGIFASNAGMTAIAGNSNTVTLYKNQANTAWTASGEKQCIGTVSNIDVQ